jgi:hypothetical protein
MLAAKKIDRAAHDMLLGSFFSDERQRLFADAVPYYLALSRLAPPAAYPLEQLALLMRKFGNDVAVAGNFCLTRAKAIKPQ